MNRLCHMLLGAIGYATTATMRERHSAIDLWSCMRVSTLHVVVHNNVEGQMLFDGATVPSEGLWVIPGSYNTFL